MTLNEQKKMQLLVSKIKENGVGFTKEDMMLVGLIALCKESVAKKQTEKNFDEMIKLIDKYPKSDEFLERAIKLIPN